MFKVWKMPFLNIKQLCYKCFGFAFDDPDAIRYVLSFFEWVSCSLTHRTFDLEHRFSKLFWCNFLEFLLASLVVCCGVQSGRSLFKNHTFEPKFKHHKFDPLLSNCLLFSRLASVAMLEVQREELTYCLLLTGMFLDFICTTDSAASESEAQINILLQNFGKKTFFLEKANCPLIGNN